MRPAITLPFGNATSSPVSACPSVTATGVPGSNGLRWPYWRLTYPPLVTVME